MTTHLLCDRQWIVNWTGPNCSRGTYRFQVAPPAKPAAPVLVADKPWESMSNGWGTLRIEEGCWRLWYEAWDDQYRNDFDGRLCYAESPDGVHWVKPELGLVEYRGNKANNIIFDGQMAGGLGFHGSSIFVDPTSPPEARYRLLFMGGLMRRENREDYGLHAMSFAYSADGLHWQWGVPEQESWLNPPVASFGSDTQSVAYWDERRRQYVGYFRTWEPSFGRAIGRATTDNFGRWPRPETILAADEDDPFGEDLYNNAAARYEVPGDAAHFFFISVFDHASDTLRIQLATSRDGRQYKRLCRDPFVSPGDTFDCGGAYMCPGIHQVGDESVMLYHAVPYKHDQAQPVNIRYAGGYVLLRFPRDRFQGLHADDYFECSLPVERNADGTLAVTLNAAVTPGGRLRAGILLAKYAQDYLPGFAPDDCEPLTGDGVRLPLRWKGGALPATDEPLELRLIIEKATVFGYSFGE